MTLNFTKYQGTGNDFIIINDPTGELKLKIDALVPMLCKRRLGIGADGLILISPCAKTDYEVVYFNSDGSQSFCGNGARCAVHFAHNNGYFHKETTFSAIDGVHQAFLEGDEVHLAMQDVEGYEVKGADYIIHTGSPHYIRFDILNSYDIVDFGRKIRYSDDYRDYGINVNLAEEKEGDLTMCTYERGVEDETLSCGTGATAVALAWALANGELGSINKTINVKGGRLRVKADRHGDAFRNIWLIGPAKQVFEGVVNV
ncbi:MAG: diaminopimelate epimerase [Crocinitomicaceae bacterium]|nr:diaminopimelate epimerase [Crocinitomicaceae bacterium]